MKLLKKNSESITDAQELTTIKEGIENNEKTENKIEEKMEEVKEEVKEDIQDTEEVAKPDKIVQNTCENIEKSNKQNRKK